MRHPHSLAAAIHHASHTTPHTYPEFQQTCPAGHNLLHSVAEESCTWGGCNAKRSGTDYNTHKKTTP